MKREDAGLDYPGASEVLCMVPHGEDETCVAADIPIASIELRIGMRAVVSGGEEREVISPRRRINLL